MEVVLYVYIYTCVRKFLACGFWLTGARFRGNTRDGNDEKWFHSIFVAHGNDDTEQSSVLMRPQSYCRDEMRVMSVGRQDHKALFIGTFA